METLSPPDLDLAATELAARIAPYLEAAEKHGLHLRPITGQILRLGDQFGIDVMAVGDEVRETETGSDEEKDRFELFYDELMTAVWLLCEDEEILIDVSERGGKAPGQAATRWKLRHLATPAAEAAAMRAFIGRWYEHRLEMARLYGAGEAAPADA